MAEETPLSPVEPAEIPKASPLSSAGAGTLKLNPIAPHKPIVGAPQAGLRPGLKLPPKPGATATAALKPGLKLPPKPGATVALKPGLKMPTKPVIHKPGATVAAKPLPKPVVAAAAAAPAAAPAPATPAAAPAPAATPAPVAPAVSAGIAASVTGKIPPLPTKPAVPVDAQGVGKLPTVQGKPVAREEAAPVVTENPKPMEALKSVTQKLKGITQQIPQQAILRKTGIIADAAMTDAQKQAAKSKTARISLSDAMGVAPVKNENAPMKTIRIKRPSAIPAPVDAKPAAPTPAAAEPAAAEDDATITQRKTLKISRPGGGAVRPTGKFGIKRPAAQPAAAPADDAATQATTAPVAGGDVADVADIPSIPDMTAVAPAAADNGPAWAWTLSSLVQAAACAAMGALLWFLYQNTVTNYF